VRVNALISPHNAAALAPLSRKAGEGLGEGASGTGNINVASDHAALADGAGADSVGERSAGGMWGSAQRGWVVYTPR
jgi:hypothetical protein